MLGISDDTIFTRQRPLLPTRYMKAPHPKTSIKPDLVAIQRILDSGWVAQFKVHGHRAQIHIHANPQQASYVFNRQGKLHKKSLSKTLEDEIRRILQPKSDWTVLDCEWLKGDDKLFLFDILRQNGEALHHMTYEDRYERLPRIYRSPHIETLGIWKQASHGFEAIETAPAYIEGFVLKAFHTKGFSDTSVIRCRWPGRSQHL